MTNPDFNDAVAQEVRRLQGAGGGGYQAPEKEPSGPRSFDNPIIQDTFRGYKERDGVLGPKAWYREMFKQGEYPQQLAAIQEMKNRTTLTRLGIIEGLGEQFGTFFPETGGGWADSKEQKRVSAYIDDYKSVLWSKGMSPASAHQLAIAAARKAFPHLSSDAITASVAPTTIPRRTSFGAVSGRGGIDLGTEIGAFRAPEITRDKLIEILGDPNFHAMMKDAHEKKGNKTAYNRDRYLQDFYDDYYAQILAEKKAKGEKSSEKAIAAQTRQEMADKAHYISVAMALLGIF